MEATALKMEKFVKACEEGNLGTVRNLLRTVSEQGFPRKELEAKLRPPIYWACKSGNLDVVKILIDRYPDCDPLFVNDSGSNLLYIACARGHVSVVDYLNLMYSMNPKHPNGLGTTPIFAATYNGHFDMVKYLIYKFNCDPTNLNVRGESLLHIACDRNHLKIARYLVEEHNLDPSLQSASKKSPLHSACSNGNLFIARYLIEELHCKTDVFDQSGYTPVHIACRNGFDDIVKYFIEHKHNLCLYDNSGYMPLHVGCRFRRKNVVEALLKQGNFDPNTRTLTDETPLQVIKGEDNDLVNCLIRSGASTSGMELSIFKTYKLKYPLHSVIHTFVIGHSASGKSTLVKALQHSTTFFKRGNIDVQPHTVGVIPVEFDSQEFGRIILYDFAGDYEFHPCHAALLEHSKFTSPPLFILVLNLLDTTEESKRRINYWIQFVENHPVLEKSSAHIFVIGSHFDKIQERNPKIAAIEGHVRSRLEFSTLMLDGYFSIDCRLPSKLFRRSLKQSYEFLHSLCMEVVDPACHVLSALLSENIHENFACNIQRVLEIASASSYPLPLQAECLCKLSESLSAFTKMLFLRNDEQPNRSWIVLDIYALLHNINGKIFAPTGFIENVFKPMNTGVLTWSELSREFPDLDPSMIIPFLSRLEFCQVISDRDVLDLITDDNERDAITKPVSNTLNLSLELEEKYLFFPGLISPEEPKDNIWTSDDFEFYSGWCLRCDCDQQFFSIRFLHTLLLRLSFGFAVTRSASGQCDQLECTLWRSGLRWLNLDGIETIVEMVEDRKALLLLIRIKKDSILKGLQLRAAIIRKILDTKEEYCVRIITSESFIHPADLKARCCYPVINKRVDELRRFDITLIAKAFCTNKPYVRDVKAEELIKLDRLIEFDPYMRVGTRFLQRLYQEDRQNYSLTEDLLMEFSEYYPDKARTFENILFDQRSPSCFSPAAMGSFPPSCFEVLHRYWESGTLTLADFRKKLDSYSVFCGRNILNYC